MLLGERLRQSVEQSVVRQVLVTLLPHVVLDPAAMCAAVFARCWIPSTHEASASACGRYTRMLTELNPAASVPEAPSSAAVWIPSTVRTYSLVAACLASDEPVLLVGETGTGKTTICQLYAQAIGQTLQMINCHQHTETADFIGGLRPARGRAFQLEELSARVHTFVAQAAALHATTRRPAGRDAEQEPVATGPPCGESVEELAGLLDAAAGPFEVRAEAVFARPATGREVAATIAPLSVDQASLMKVAGLREALLLRGLDAGGKRAALLSRLLEAGAKASLLALDPGTSSLTRDTCDSVLDAQALSMAREARSIRVLATACKALFVWEDGPLLTAMKRVRARASDGCPALKSVYDSWLPAWLWTGRAAAY